MPALSPTTTLPMEPPSTQSLFARSWRYLDQGDVYRLLRGHYSPVLALTDSFVDPTRSPLLRPKPRSRSLCRLRPAPAAGGTFPTLSLRILPCVPGPLSRRSRGVHLPVSSSTSSAFPRTLSRSASRVNPSKRFHDGSPFRDCSHFVMFRPSGLLASPIVPTAAAYLPQGSRGFYVRAEHASLPPHASDMLTTRPGNWWCGDLHPTRFSALSAAPVKWGCYASHACRKLAADVRPCGDGTLRRFLV